MNDLILFLDRLRSAQEQQAKNHRIMEDYYLKMDDENERRRSMLNRSWAETKERNASTFRRIIDVLKYAQSIPQDHLIGG